MGSSGVTMVTRGSKTSRVGSMAGSMKKVAHRRALDASKNLRADRTTARDLQHAAGVFIKH